MAPADFEYLLPAYRPLPPTLPAPRPLIARAAPMTVEPVKLAEVHIGARKRRLGAARVAELAGSIKELGLRQPITIQARDDGTLDLVAGAHRLAAAKKLGWREIECIRVTLGELNRELWEIDENLIRAELTELERAEHLRRRKEIFEAKGAKKIATPGGEQRIGFDRDAADKTGLSKETARKSRIRAEKIAPDVKAAIADLPAADNGVELDALAGLGHDQQREAVAAVAAGTAKNFRAAALAPSRERRRYRGRTGQRLRAAGRGLERRFRRGAGALRRFPGRGRISARRGSPRSIRRRRDSAIGPLGRSLPATAGGRAKPLIRRSVRKTAREK